jgi:inhibitor of the pro-sigma K processing machinery
MYGGVQLFGTPCAGRFRGGLPSVHLLSKPILSRPSENIPACSFLEWRNFMQEILALAVPVLFIFLFIKILLTPMKLIFKLLLNTGCGFICLFLLNLLSGITGIVFELNFITAAIVGFLGLPGIVLLLVVQYLL